MGFDIALRWDTLSTDRVLRNRKLADVLLATVSGLREFPLDTTLIAGLLGVPLDEIFMHWSQIELHTSDALLGVQLDLWYDRAYLILPSNPPGGCASALALIEPLLGLLRAHGVQPVEPSGMLTEYEAQRSRVLRVAEIVGGTA